MGYTPSFTPQYENGWEDLPSETSPITATALNAYDDAIENIENYLASDESQGNLADAYDETETYAVGDYVIYGGDLYKCTTAISTAEEWDSTHWTPCLITDEMGHGGGGSNVSITPTLSTGTKIADFEIDGQTGELYAPTGGGGSANIWTGTQAELEEVFDELEEGTQINITDDEQEVVEGGTIYSEEEQVIGLWTDNKPLYQRTFIKDNITLTTNALADIAEIPNIDHIHIVEGLCTDSGVDYVVPEMTLRIRYNSTSEKLQVQCTASSWSNATAKVTVQYTKSTDAPLDVVVGKSTMYIASSDCYSTEEKEVGCAPNGKPLYQKTILHENPFTGSESLQAIAHGISNFDEAVSITGFIYDAHETTPSWMPLPRFYTSNAFGISHITTSDIYIYIPSAFGTRLRNARITIQYTKTTDTAGSGSYTPASGKAVHYSTDEQVIGTWIDGKPLYRRTITGLSIQLNGTTWVNYNPSISIDKLINVHAYYEPSGGLMTCAIAEYQYNSSVGIQLTAVQGYNRTVNTLTIEYTKTTD